MPNWKRIVVSGSDATLNTLTVSNGITGSLQGTASYATQALSASYAPSAGGATFPFTGSAIITGSLNVIGNTTITGSFNASGSLYVSASRVYVGTTTTTQYTPAGSGMTIVGPNQSTQNNGTLEIFSNDTGADNGGNIILGGMQQGPIMYALAKIVSGFIGGSYGGYLSFWTELVSSGLTEKMRITSTGLVGIGTTTPTAVLHLKAGTATANTAPLKLTTGTNLTTPEAGTIEFNGTNLFFTTGSTRSIILTNTNPAGITGSAIITGSLTVTGSFNVTGNVNIGTTSPGSLLQVGGSGATATATPTAIQMDNSYRNAVGGNTSLKFYFYKNGTETYGFGVNNAAGIEYHAGVTGGGTAYHAFYTDTTEKVRITAAGNIGIGTTTPSAKLDVNGNAVITGTLLVSGEKLVAGYSPTPLQGTIQDGITSVLGSLHDWDSDYYQGTVLYSETAGATITFGQLCYRTNAQTWALADATAIASSATHMLGICVASSTATEPTSILINGFVETTNYATILKAGEPLYMDTTAGSMTKTAPTTAGNIVRLIGNTFWDSNSPGMSNNKTVIHFNPDRSWIEL